MAKKKETNSIMSADILAVPQKPWGPKVTPEKNVAAIDKVKQREIDKSNTKGITPGNQITQKDKNGFEWF